MLLQCGGASVLLSAALQLRPMEEIAFHWAHFRLFLRPMDGKNFHWAHGK
jgi:hypothetical protein